jgi:hypothetical protein
MSWIAIEDLVGIIHHSIHNVSVNGPVNAVSPNPVTNSEFTRILGHVLSRPSFFALPAFAARIVFGQMANELLLASARVNPDRLVRSGFSFRFAGLEDALRHMLLKSTA